MLHTRGRWMDSFPAEVGTGIEGNEILTRITLVGVILQLVLTLGELEVVRSDDGVKGVVAAAGLLAGVAVAMRLSGRCDGAQAGRRLTRGHACRCRPRPRR